VVQFCARTSPNRLRVTIRYFMIWWMGLSLHEAYMHRGWLAGCRTKHSRDHQSPITTNQNVEKFSLCDRRKSGHNGQSTPSKYPNQNSILKTRWYSKNRCMPICLALRLRPGSFTMSRQYPISVDEYLYTSTRSLVLIMRRQYISIARSMSNNL